MASLLPSPPPAGRRRACPKHFPCAVACRARPGACAIPVRSIGQFRDWSRVAQQLIRFLLYFERFGEGCPAPECAHIALGHAPSPARRAVPVPLSAPFFLDVCGALQLIFSAFHTFSNPVPFPALKTSSKVPGAARCLSSQRLALNLELDDAPVERRAPPASSRSPCESMNPPRRSNRLPCPATAGLKYSDATASPRRRWPGR